MSSQLGFLCEVTPALGTLRGILTQGRKTHRSPFHSTHHVQDRHFLIEIFRQYVQPARSHCDQREKYDIDDFHAFQESEPVKSISSRLRRHRRAVVRPRAGIKARTDLRIQTRRSHFEEHCNNEKQNASPDKSANCLVPNTIAFGVATRSTKAKEHAQVAGCVGRHVGESTRGARIR